MAKEIEYSTKPITIWEWRLMQRCQAGDPEAFVALMLARTNLVEEEINALDMDDVHDVVAELGKAISASVQLMSLGRQL